MDFLILALFCISCIGYFRFFQMTFRMTFSSAVFFSTCAALVLLMTAGIFRVILPIVCLVFSGGFLLILKDFFTLQQKRLHLHEHWLSRIKSYLRMEYVFWSAIVVFFYSYLILYRGDLGSPDIYSAWYNQFYYMILNNTWSDKNYINYASSYAMIGNSFPIISQNCSTTMERRSISSPIGCCSSTLRCRCSVLSSGDRFPASVFSG